MESLHSAIYQNLRLLVQMYPKLDMEPKIQEGMFKKPNTKGMHSVFYSLMMILKPEYCRQYVPWPVQFQSDNYKFRLSVINFIKTECQDFEPPKLLASLINKADGNKYVRLVFDFVTYVTKTILKREKYIILNMSDSVVDEEEAINIFNDITQSNSESIHDEKESSITQYRKMIEDSCEFINALNEEKKMLMKEIHCKKNSVNNDLNSLSYTMIHEKSIINQAVSDYEEDLWECQRNYLLIQDEVRQLLDRKERLLRLIALQQNSSSNELINANYLKSVITEDLTRAIHVPFSTIVYSLFVESEHGHLISLKDFFHFGYLLLQSRVQRFLKSKIPDQPDVVHQQANDIVSHVTIKIGELKVFDEALHKIIQECEQTMPNVQNEHDCKPAIVETMRVILSMSNYRSQPLLHLSEKSLLFEEPETKESDEKMIIKLKEFMRKYTHEE